MSDLSVKIKGFKFETAFAQKVVVLIALAGSRKTFFGGKVEQQGQIRLQSAGGYYVELGNQFAIKTAPSTLIGGGRIDKPVAQNRGSGRKGREDNLLDVLRAGGGVKEQFGAGGHCLILRVEQDGSNFIGNGTTTGLPGQQNREPLLDQVFAETTDLGRFTAPLDPFKSNEKCHEFSRLEDVLAIIERGLSGIKEKARQI